MSLKDAVYALIIILLATLIWIIFHRRDSVKKISIDTKVIKTAIEFEPGTLREIASEIEKLELSEAISSHRPNKFAVSVLQIGGEGSRLINKTVWSLEEHAYYEPDDYISVYFNGPTDLMWVAGPNDYKVTKSSSDISLNDHTRGLALGTEMKNSIYMEFEKVNQIS